MPSHELSPKRGQIIALAAYLNFRFGARDFLSDVSQYQLLLTYVLPMNVTHLSEKKSTTSTII
jgi:hypothetical protein